ncbi:MAG TPA: serine/threonine-protein kinase, partial [Gemmatimonadales bacterium]|nr:serine/threonine-protein kinase [Gemmatimonadales bacterium]
LAYAHREGVVHRDIKPDNILLADGHAVVTDFGVAKAVASSTGESGLTSLGVALGTPAYMAPEQAAADPHVDHRADLYAIGAMAYEMLTGRPPFTGSTAQAVLAAHMTQAPDAVTTHRATVPPALNELILRCLAKKPADRPQRADELLPHLDALLTPSGGMTPTGAQPAAALDHAATARRAHPLRVGALFAVAALGVLAVTYALMQSLSLPTWVFTGTIGLLAIGFPIMIWSGHRERQRAVATMTGMATMTPVGLERHFTIRKALIGGGLAFGSLALLGGGYAVTRAMGIGPAATLVTRGVLAPQDTLVLVAQFADHAGDSALAAAVTTAVRIDFAQSNRFSLVPPQMIQTMLELMRRGPETPIAGEVAREVAQRLSLKAMVTGDVSRLGNSYALSASLVSPETGETYAAVRETAGPDDVVQAVDRLAKGLRERIGESLRSLRASEPLGWATTESLDALKAWTRATAAAARGDSEREVALLEEAIALDSNFADAYRRLAVALSNIGRDPARWRWAATRAFQLRDRLGTIGRQLVTGYYYGGTDYDPPKAIAAYRAVVERAPLHGSAANNLALLYVQQRRWKDAEAVIRPLVDTGSTYWTHVNVLLVAQHALHDSAGIRHTLTTLAQRAPDDPWLRLFRAQVAGSWTNYRAADSAMADLARVAPSTGVWGVRQAVTSRALALVRGRLREAERAGRRAMELNENTDPPAVARFALELAAQRLLLANDTAGARAIADSALANPGLRGANPENRPYLEQVQWHALAGQAASAERSYREYEASVPAQARKVALDDEYAAQAAIARAAGRYDAAIAGYRKAGEWGPCQYCWLWELGQVFDQAGQPDSAVAVYERALLTPGRFRLGVESPWRGPALKRLGELYEQRGDRDRAVDYYGRFVELWKEADSELQPLVADVRERIARLSRERS